MDAEYLKAKARMCRMYNGYCNDICPLGGEVHGRDYQCHAFEMDNPEECVEIVRGWAKENPVKTRRSEFLKIFPNAAPLYIDPCHINTNMMDNKCRNKSCFECRQEYWNQEVDDEFEK